LAATAKDLLNKAVKQREDQVRKKQSLHPDDIALLHIDLALAQSNVELVEALNALTAAAGKNSGGMKDAITALTSKVAELAKR
jgi:NACalpha-BTF3-like transcription factor